MRRIQKKDNIIDATRIGTWASNNSVGIYDISSPNGLNAIIGLAKHRNSDGTVLYRGQCDLYEHLIPSIRHDMSTYPINNTILTTSLEKMYADSSLNDFFKWDTTVSGWKLYITTTYEAALQHYGAKTRSVDFVDNHWTALWFALNRYDPLSGNYSKRSSSDNFETSNRWINFDSNVFDRHGSYGFIFLYLADTSVPEVNGLYMGKTTYTVDLRKALPESFLRPTAQHGWVVRKKEESAFDDEKASKSKANDYLFDNEVVAILRIKTDLIDKMLGNGILLSQKNFFPSADIDKGYKRLKSLQGISVDSTLPEKMLQEYQTLI